MTQQECEKLIKAKMLEIRDIAAEYMGDKLEYLSMYYSVANADYAEYFSVYSNGDKETDVRAIERSWFDGEPLNKAEVE